MPASLRCLAFQTLNKSLKIFAHKIEIPQKWPLLALWEFTSVGKSFLNLFEESEILLCLKNSRQPLISEKTIDFLAFDAYFRNTLTVLRI